MPVTTTTLSFADLDGWAQDDHAAAWAVFNETRPHLAGPEWDEVPAAEPTDARAWFETWFDPVLIEGSAAPLFTGYFEPELEGALHPSPAFPCAIYRAPLDASLRAPWLARREIETTGVLQGSEIAWLADPLEVFFLQVQGSGRIRLPDGQTIRVGFAAKNNHPYRSIGQELVRRGAIPVEALTTDAIRDWAAAHRQDVQEVLWSNPSYVFFREVTEVPADKGPLGFLGASVTPMRTVAVDPAHILLGSPVWIETDAPGPLRRLMVAQDIGGAIKGPQRADIFVGTGPQAGDIAGRINAPGRLIVLRPKSGGSVA